MLLPICVHRRTSTAQMLCRLPSVIFRIVESDPFDLIVQDSVLVFLMVEDTFDLVLLLGLKFDILGNYNRVVVWIAIPPPSLQSRDIDDIMDPLGLWEVQAVG